MSEFVEEDEFSRFKLAQLWYVVDSRQRENRKTYLHNRVVNGILKDNFNVNYKVTIIIDLLDYKIDLSDCTALHFLFYTNFDIDAFTTLLHRGADFTIRNGSGQTVLHLIMNQYPGYLTAGVVIFISAVLSAHVRLQVAVNPHDDYGFSHLHAACIANHVESVQLFLENGASVDEFAPEFAGHTPLHFAMKFQSFEVAHILIKRGANMNALTAKQKSPLDVFMTNKHEVCFHKVEIAEKEQVIKLLLENNKGSGIGLSSLHAACTLNDLTIAERLLDQGADIDYAAPAKLLGFSGDTALHFAVENSIDAVKMLLRRGANINVAESRGRTPLQMCIYKYGLRDICDILSCAENLKAIHLSDGVTRLLDMIPTMGKLGQFKLFLQNRIKDIRVIVPNDSILWPSYTILHFAVTFANVDGLSSKEFENEKNKTIVEEYLNHGLSVNAQDARGQTPIHVAFYQKQFDIVRLMLKHLKRLENVPDIADNDNLSYLHIACALSDVSLVETLLESSDPNIAYNGEYTPIVHIVPGATPLHIAAVNRCHPIADMLLRCGADVHATDRYGRTPIHWLPYVDLSEGHFEIADILFDSFLINPKKHVVGDIEPSYLHIACLFGNVEAVKKFIDLGSNVNAIIKYDSNSDISIWNTVLKRYRFYSNCTPLKMAIQSNDLTEGVVDLLLHSGADIFVKDPDISSNYPKCIPISNKCVLLRFMQVLWDREDMQKCMEERLGLTKLHIACYINNEVAIESLLKDGFDVNAPINADSVIFGGCTPLHLLMTTIDSEELYDDNDEAFDIDAVIDLLVDHGVDVTTTNTNKDTPIHVFYKRQNDFFDGNRCKTLLLNAQQNFSVNPVNAEGLSHFHLACFWLEVEIVQKFLQHGSVDVNRPVDCFANNFAGFTPLHLALSNEMTDPDGDWRKLSQIIDLLLKNGADVNAKDVHGDTPLHKPAALRSPKMRILKMLASYGGNIRSKNTHGRTPIEELIDTRRVDGNLSDIITVFRNYGYNINSWNHLTGEGYIAKLFLLDEKNLSKNSKFKKFAKSSNARTVDDLGRTAIHNSVAVFNNRHLGRTENFIYAVQSFLAIGINIDYQDKLGQTALHYAARMENVSGVEALLACGADINIVDSSGKLAFSYGLEHERTAHYQQKNCTSVLRFHIMKLQHLKIEVSQLNQNLLVEVQYIFDRPIDRLLGELYNNLPRKFFSQVEMTKTLEIRLNSLTLFDFLSETGAVNLYSLLRRSEQDLVDFFKSFNFDKFKELAGIIKLQLRKMSTRLELMDPAFSSLRTLLGFSVPGLCEQISLYLLNSDLKNLIESTTLGTR